MKYRKLGNTGLQVSEVGFGTIPILQGNVPVLPNYYNLEEAQAIAVMEHAYHLGCNLYDTAIVPEYGDAEIKLGKFAAKIGREHLIISDKARFFSGNEIYQAVEESCKNLGTYADIYFVHQVDPENMEEVFQKDGALDALTELKACGKIRFAGIASHYYDVLLRGASDSRVDVLQASGNLFERGMLERIMKEPLFSEKGILVNKVFAAGLLPAFFSAKSLIEAVFSFQKVSCVQIGIGQPWQADAAMGWETKKYSCPPFSYILSVLEKEFDPIPCNRCQKCYCPYGTEIHTIFRQYHYYFMGKDYWALRKLNLGIQQSAEQCRKCTIMPCLSACPAHIRIPDEIQKLEKLVKDHPIWWD